MSGQDTLESDFPLAHCADCSMVGCNIAHNGKYVPKGQIAYFCLSCWRSRIDYFDLFYQAKPLATEVSRG